MSSQQATDDVDKKNDAETESDQSNSDLASKLSQELSNWRRRRSSARPRKNEPNAAVSSSSQADSARTIKVRGHETLVIRKPKLTAKPSNGSQNSNH
jgi:hypothetical protein